MTPMLVSCSDTSKAHVHPTSGSPLTTQIFSFSDHETSPQEPLLSVASEADMHQPVHLLDMSSSPLHPAVVTLACLPCRVCTCSRDPWSGLLVVHTSPLPCCRVDRHSRTAISTTHTVTSASAGVSCRFCIRHRPWLGCLGRLARCARIQPWLVHRVAACRC